MDLGEEDREVFLPETPALDAALDVAYNEYLEKWERSILTQARVSSDTQNDI